MTAIDLRPRYRRILESSRLCNTGTLRWALDQHARNRLAGEYRAISPSDAKAYSQLQVESFKQLEKSRKALGDRRELEHALADRIDRLADESDPEYEYFQKLVTAMVRCRQSGAVGVQHRCDGSSHTLVAWDEKCGLPRLCPDESHQETRRLIERYCRERCDFEIEECRPGTRTIMEHIKAGGRVYYGVLTLPNYPRGRLREGLQHIATRVRNRIWRAQKDGKRALPIRGVLTVVESPLSADGTWNVHANVLILADKHMRYEDAKRLWGADNWVRFYSVAGTAHQVVKTMRELVKYSAAPIASKSAQKADQGGPAPAMLEWDDAAIREFLLAIRGYRRTRALGCFHGVRRPLASSINRIGVEACEWVGRIAFTQADYVVTWAKINATQQNRGPFDDPEPILDTGEQLDDSPTAQRPQISERGPPWPRH